MNKRAATHNILHAALYIPEKHRIIGLKQLVEDDITRILQKAKSARCRDGIFHLTTEVTVSADWQDLSCYSNNRNICELRM